MGSPGASLEAEVLRQDIRHEQEGRRRCSLPSSRALGRGVQSSEGSEWSTSLLISRSCRARKDSYGDRSFGQAGNPCCTSKIADFCVLPSMPAYLFRMFNMFRGKFPFKIIFLFVLKEPIGSEKEPIGSEKEPIGSEGNLQKEPRAPRSGFQIPPPKDSYWEWKRTYWE